MLQRSLQLLSCILECRHIAAPPVFFLVIISHLCLISSLCLLSLITSLIGWRCVPASRVVDPHLSQGDYQDECQCSIGTQCMLMCLCHIGDDEAGPIMRRSVCNLNLRCDQIELMAGDLTCMVVERNNNIICIYYQRELYYTISILLMLLCTQF